ncbi:MAG: hypothetical protein ABJA67_10405, partial [Chthonomonadales bacterium]
MGRILVYKIVTDDNGAPCVTDEMLTLAICKPGYRHVAEEGDFLFAFMGRSVMPDGSEPLVYIAEITSILGVREYHGCAEYIHRPDNIYRLVSDKFEIVQDSLYHTAADIPRDVGEQGDRKVLVSRNFRYWGKEAKKIDSTKYPFLSDLIHDLGQANYPPRKAITDAAVRECEQLIGQSWLENSRMKLGMRTHPPGARDCGDGSDPRSGTSEWT